MISPEELSKLKELMDTAFAYKVSDIVQPYALGDLVARSAGHNTASYKQPDGSWKNIYTIGLNNRDTMRYQIVERWLQQCHGGVQKHYRVRLVAPNGLFDKDILSVTEDEISLSRPHQRYSSMKRREIIDWAMSLPEDGPDEEAALD